MKKKQVNIGKSGFGELLEESTFSLPFYQRKYSWQEKNWRDFVESLTNLIDDDDEEKNENSVKFFGNIILQRQNDNDDEYFIIDGQQRLISISLFFLVVYEILEDSKNRVALEEEKEWEIMSIRGEIKNYLFTSKKMNLRIKFNNKEDESDYEYLLRSSFNLLKMGEEKPKTKTLISKAKNFVKDTILNELMEEGYSVTRLYKAAKRLYFSVIILTGNDDEIIQEMFMSLNSTGLNLNTSDLLKSLLIKHRGKLEAKKVQKVWDEEIVGVITENGGDTSINSEMNRFFLDFYLAKFGPFGKISDKKFLKLSEENLYRLFRYKIEKDNIFQPGQMLNLLKEYAEVYFHIKQASHYWWINERKWPVELVYVLEDIKLLGFRQLYPLVLSIFFEFKNIKEKEKTSIVNYLEKLVAYIFRTTTIKEKISRGIHQSVTTQIIKESILGQGNTNLFDSDEVRRKLKEEFNDEEDNILYTKLESHHTSANKIWKFVLEKIYWRKFQEKINIEEKSKFFNKLQWREAFQLEHIIPVRGKKEGKFVDYKDENIKYLLGNTTLLRKDDNLKVSNKSWSEKKSWFLTLGDNCCLNWENYEDYKENPYIFSLLKIENLLSDDDIKFRTSYLVNELRRYEILEAEI